MAPLWCVRLCCAIMMALVPGVALAQGSAGNKAAAEALFQEGRSLMQKQQYQEACSKLEASQDLDAGLGTLMLLSDCYEKTGRTASAWATFREAAAMARGKGDEEREKVARARADALEPNLAKLVVQGAESTLKLAGLEVKMAGQAVPRAQWGTPIPVDPGAVQFEVSAPGYKPWTLEAQVVPGPSQTAIDIPELQPLSPEAANATGADGQAVAPSDGSDPRADAGTAGASASSGGNWKTTGLVLGIAGVVAVGVGSYFGLSAKSKNDDSKAACPNNLCETQAGLDARNDAKTAATASTLTFILGGALLATGGVLYFMEDSNESAGSRRELRWSSRVGPAGAQLGLEGTW